MLKYAMNKIDDAWTILKGLPSDEQEIAAEAILDYAARRPDLGLSEAQAAEIRSRLNETDPKTITPAELRARIFES
jgi:putative addiction module component (TIGR02574 family)